MLYPLSCLSQTQPGLYASFSLFSLNPDFHPASKKTVFHRVTFVGEDANDQNEDDKSVSWRRAVLDAAIVRTLKRLKAQQQEQHEQQEQQQQQRRRQQASADAESKSTPAPAPARSKQEMEQEEMRAYLQKKKDEEALRGHKGEYRDAKNKQRLSARGQFIATISLYCGDSRSDGTCSHGGEVIRENHFSCCGLVASTPPTENTFSGVCPNSPLNCNPVTLAAATPLAPPKPGYFSLDELQVVVQRELENRFVVERKILRSQLEWLAAENMIRQEAPGVLHYSFAEPALPQAAPAPAPTPPPPEAAPVPAPVPSPEAAPVPAPAAQEAPPAAEEKKEPQPQKGISLPAPLGEVAALPYGLFREASSPINKKKLRDWPVAVSELENLALKAADSAGGAGPLSLSEREQEMKFASMMVAMFQGGAGDGLPSVSPLLNERKLTPAMMAGSPSTNRRASLKRTYSVQPVVRDDTKFLPRQLSSLTFAQVEHQLQVSLGMCASALDLERGEALLLLLAHGLDSRAAMDAYLDDRAAARKLAGLCPQSSSSSTAHFIVEADESGERLCGICFCESRAFLTLWYAIFFVAGTFSAESAGA